MKAHASAALVSGLGLFFALSVARMDSTIGAVLAVLTLPPAPLEVRLMSQITKSKTTPDGVTHSQTWTQLPGESNADFRARAAREWAAYCADLGA